MKDFDFLKKFVLPNEKESNNPIYGDYKHVLFPLKKEEIHDVDSLFQIPFELKLFYEEIGYGFFFQKSSTYFNRLLDPFSFKMINLREDFYEFDPDLEYYKNEGKLIFFEICEGVYLMIDEEDKNGKNSIYYFNKKIADSLEEFLIKFDNEERYFVT